MAKTHPCKSCGHEVAISANKCPNCGQMTANGNVGYIITTVVVGGLAIAFLSLFG